MTAYGAQVTKRFSGELAARGITIVSGFMYGVDAMAHRAAIDAGGRTIAVMPCGIDHIHPAYQKKLYEDIIASGGLIVSEYEGDILPQHWTYPARNRIVAGLSQAVLVVEAALKSGSLITAQIAQRLGRGLFAVPGPVTSKTSRGTLELIRNGALMALDPEDILAYFNGAGWVSRDIARVGHREDQALLDELARCPQTIDELALSLMWPVEKIARKISLMELENIIGEEDGRYLLKQEGLQR